MKKLVALMLLFSAVTVQVFADETAMPVLVEERTCENASCTCNPCECNPCACEAGEEIACCGEDNCPHGDSADDHKNNK